jgi:hypothetical protein
MNPSKDYNRLQELARFKPYLLSTRIWGQRLRVSGSRGSHKPSLQLRLYLVLSEKRRIPLGILPPEQIFTALCRLVPNAAGPRMRKEFSQGTCREGIGTFAASLRVQC